MQYIGKKIVDFGFVQFIGDEYAVKIKGKVWESILKHADRGFLEKVLETQIRFENYEAAEQVKQALLTKS